MAANRDTAAFGLLPSIKCSSCGDQIEISLMGEHICRGLPQRQRKSRHAGCEYGVSLTSHTATPPNSGKQIGQQSQNHSRNTSAGGYLKPGRKASPPPRIDPYLASTASDHTDTVEHLTDDSLADRPFLRPNELTPASSKHGSRSVSPQTPFLDPQKGYQATGRSMTSPLPQSPPSPEFANLDCAFPPFPTTGPRGASRTGTPVNDSRGLMSVFNDGYPKDAPRPQSRSASTSRQRDRSTSSNAGRSRGNTLASSPSTSGSSKRRPSITSNFSSAFGDEDGAPPIPALPSWTSQTESVTSNGNRPERTGGYGGMGVGPSPYAQMNPYAMPSGSVVASPEDVRPPTFMWPGSSNSNLDNFTKNEPKSPPVVRGRSTREQSVSSPTRSQTFPLRNEPKSSNDGPNRRPSEPMSQARRRALAAKDDTVQSEAMDQVFRPAQASIVPPSSPGALPPRKDSRPAPGALFNFASKVGTAASVLRNFAPTLQGTSSATNINQEANMSSHTPSDSASSNGSEMSAVSAASSKSSISGSPPRQSPPHLKQPSLEVPVPKFDRQIQPDSPTDPLFQQGRLSPVPRSGRSPSPTMKRQASPESVRRPPTRSGTTKGTCRGCAKPILAGEKSVSCADGRLTGRYHKTCFACHVCRSPFPTADFYILDNAPYCGKHYHEANGSLCADCGDGIEGQYLEADTDETVSKPSGTKISPSPGPKKFHPGCFTCGTCKLMLNDDFYAFGGKIYCERDAFKAAEKAAGGHSRTSSRGSSRVAAVNRANGLLTPGMGMPTGTRKFPERRTTKLLMI